MNENYVLLNSDTVLNNLINLKQLTFEVTDACNLKCKYCGYGEFYDDYDERTNRNLSIKRAINLLEFLEDKWNSRHSSSIKKRTTISFYGGEPLLNISFIKEIVSWIEKRELLQCHFVFSMTTNALLLKKHIEFLVKHDFRILVSLDGNKANHSYRIDHSGNNSFDVVYENIKYVKNKFPNYFDKNVSFNAVLHNKNDYSSLVDFFRKEFDKLPKVSELNTMGIKPERLREFSRLYRSKIQQLNQLSDKEFIKEILFMDNPETSSLCSFLHWHTGNVFKSYNDLLFNENQKKWIPTGTCLPFEKKMFVTVNGKILPCERISHEYALGHVDEEGVLIDVEQITIKYNNWLKKYKPQCTVCYNAHTCKHCMFYNNDLKGSGCCPYFMDKKQFDLYVESQLSYLSENPRLYKKIMKEVVIH